MRVSGFGFRASGELVVQGSYRGTSLIRKRPPLGHYSGTVPRVVWWSLWGGLFFISEVPLYHCQRLPVVSSDLAIDAEAGGDVTCLGLHAQGFHFWQTATRGHKGEQNKNDF